MLDTLSDARPQLPTALVRWVAKLAHRARRKRARVELRLL
jgi:hypothetical protein